MRRRRCGGTGSPTGWSDTSGAACPWRGRLHERLRTVEFRPAAAADDTVVDSVESRRILAACWPAWPHRRRRPAPGDMGGAARRECCSRVGDRTRHGPTTAPPGAPGNLAREYDRLQPHPTFTPATHTGGAP